MRSGTYSVTVVYAQRLLLRRLLTSVRESNTSTPTATLSASPSTTLTCTQTSLTLTAGGSELCSSAPNVVSQSGNQAIINQAGFTR